MREPPEVLTRLYTAFAFHRWKRHAASLSHTLDRRERDAVLAAYKRGHRELSNFAYTAPQLHSTYRQYLYLTDNFSDDGDEVDTDSLQPRPQKNGGASGDKTAGRDQVYWP